MTVSTNTIRIAYDTSSLAKATTDHDQLAASTSKVAGVQAQAKAATSGVNREFSRMQLEAKGANMALYQQAAQASKAKVATSMLSKENITASMSYVGLVKQLGAMAQGLYEAGKAGAHSAEQMKAFAASDASMARLKTSLDELAASTMYESGALEALDGWMVRTKNSVDLMVSAFDSLDLGLSDSAGSMGNLKFVGDAFIGALPGFVNAIDNATASHERFNAVLGTEVDRLREVKTEIVQEKMLRDLSWASRQAAEGERSRLEQKARQESELAMQSLEARQMADAQAREAGRSRKDKAGATSRPSAGGGEDFFADQAVYYEQLDIVKDALYGLEDAYTRVALAENYQATVMAAGIVGLRANAVATEANAKSAVAAAERRRKASETAAAAERARVKAEQASVESGLGIAGQALDLFLGAGATRTFTRGLEEVAAGISDAAYGNFWGAASHGLSSAAYFKASAEYGKKGGGGGGASGGGQGGSVGDIGSSQVGGGGTTVTAGPTNETRLQIVVDKRVMGEMSIEGANESVRDRRGVVLASKAVGAIGRRFW